MSGAPRGRQAAGRDGQPVALAGNIAKTIPASLVGATITTNAMPATAPVAGVRHVADAAPEAAVNEANVVVGEKYLVDQARGGSIDAFEILVRRYSPAAYRVATRLVDDHHDAQAITEEAFVSVWRTVQDPRTNASFSTCVYRAIIDIVGKRHARRRHGRTVERPDALVVKTLGPAGATGGQPKLDAAVAALPLAQRVPFVLHHFEGLSYADVAAITAADVPVVRSHLFRARRALLTALGAPEVTT